MTSEEDVILSLQSSKNCKIKAGLQDSSVDEVQQMHNVSSNNQWIINTLGLNLTAANDIHMSLNLYNFVQSDFFSNTETKVNPENPEYLFNKQAALALQMALFTNDLYAQTFATPMALEILNRMI